MTVLHPETQESAVSQEVAFEGIGYYNLTLEAQARINEIVERDHVSRWAALQALILEDIHDNYRDTPYN